MQPRRQEPRNKSNQKSPASSPTGRPPPQAKVTLKPEAEKSLKTAPRHILRVLIVSAPFYLPHTVPISGQNPPFAIKEL